MFVNAGEDIRMTIDHCGRKKRHARDRWSRSICNVYLFILMCIANQTKNIQNEWNDVCCFGGADEISNWKNGNCITLSVKRLFVCSKWKSVAPLTGAVITTDNDDDQ